MTPRLALVGLAMAAGALAGRAQTGPPQGQPAFTARTDVVMVDVSVRKDNKQVTGLSAADFELRDNGVKQQIETVEPQAVPIDLSILMDVSGNPDRPWVNLPAASEVAAQIDRRAREITRLLRPGDRVRLFALDTYLQQVWPLQAADAAPPVTRVTFDGLPALYDALLTLLLQPVEPSRRHVIVAATRGGDTFSVTPAAELREIARRSDAQLHVLMEERRADEEVSIRPFQCMYMDLCRPTYRFWIPARRRLFTAVPITVPAPLHRLLAEGEFLKAGADATGGGVYQAEGLSEPTLAGTFAAAFENFRQSYILRYSPTGVARTGWHEIEVTVPRDRSLRIKARNGYSIDAPPVAVAAPPAPAQAPAAGPGAVLRTLPELVRAFGDDEFDVVTRSLRQHADPLRLMADFTAGGPPWPASPRREAALVLEIAEAGIYARQPAARDQGAALLARFSQLVRDPIEPDPFEREWLVAAVRMWQGAIRPAVSRAFVESALARFPDDPRLVLARAIVTDQPSLPTDAIVQNGRVTRGAVMPEHVAGVTAGYEAAARFPANRAEASIRLGWFLHRVGRNAEALARFEGAGPLDPADPGLAYLRELLSGQILLALDRATDAVAAFRRAGAIVPGAQSARLALMNGLLLSGDRDEAARLAADLQGAPAATLDPWWLYWQGDYRRYPEALRRVREMIR